MKRTIHFEAAFTVILMLALASFSIGATKSARADKHLTLVGTVLNVNAQERTMLVSNLWTKQLYLVHVPADGTFRITFGMNMRAAEPQFRDVHRYDQVRLRCTSIQDRLAKLDDGREVIAVTLVN